MEPERSITADDESKSKSKSKSDHVTPPPSSPLNQTLPSSFSTSSPEPELEIETETTAQTPENQFLLDTTFPDSPIQWDESTDPISNGTELAQMMGAGLVNMGNTCFLNVILQCFTHTVPFVECLRSSSHPTPCNRYKEGFCVLCALRDHVELALSSSGGTVSPYKLVNNLSYLSSSFRRYEQEDAHEFLQCLLDKLDSSDVRSKESTSPNKEESLVNKVFGGRLKSELRCSNCGHCSDTFEPLIDLSLEIDDADSLPSALESFTKVEKIEETKFPCEKCKEDVLVEKKLSLDQTPSVAAFHLKRFKHTGSYVDKIDKYVEYPLELDLQPYCSNQENNNVESKYELYAVVVHTGYSSSSGHYFCFIRSSPQTWHRLDDYKVTRVGEEFVLSQEAYILFYARQGTPWFSTLMETQKQCPVTSPNSVLDDVETSLEPPRHFNTTSPVSSVGMKTQKKWVTISPKPVLACPMNEYEIHYNLNGDRNVEKSHSVVPLDKFNEELDKATEEVDVQPKTPSRSPSPDLYSKNEPEDSYSIPHDHLKLKNQSPHIKSANRALKDSKRKEAFRLTRSMPSDRANKFRACMLSPPSESSINKKKRKVTDALGKDRSSPGVYRKLNPALLRSVF